MEAEEFAEIIGRFLEESDNPLFCCFPGSYRTHLVPDYRSGITVCELPLDGAPILYEAGMEEGLDVPPLEDTLCGWCLKEFQDVQ